MEQKIDEKLINHLAHLSRLELSSSEKEGLIKDLNRILHYIDQLNQLDTSNAEPLVYMSPNQNILRNDEINETLKKEDALSNAPKKDSDYIRVPKIINQ